MRNLAIIIVSVIALALFGYQVYEVGYRDGATDVDAYYNAYVGNEDADADPYGNTYTVTATAYGTEQLLTPDGNIWNCGLEVVPDATYIVVFGDNYTDDITDDIILDFWTV